MVLCFEFEGVLPVWRYEEFTLDVLEVAGPASTSTVVNVPAEVQLTGVGLQAGDRVKTTKH